jgi:DNA-binding response OmpR family regulator
MSAKILIIEDEYDLFKFLKMRLESYNYQVIGAVDGKEGFELARKEFPNLILLDLMLPKVDGFWICNLLKHDERYKDIPIMIITGKSGDESVRLAEQCGADAYLLKPFEFDDLLNKITGLLKK